MWHLYCIKDYMIIPLNTNIYLYSTSIKIMDKRIAKKEAKKVREL